MKNPLFIKSGKLISIILVISFLLPSLVLMPKEAHAIDAEITADTSPTGVGGFWAHIANEIHLGTQELKEYVLDGLAWTVVNMAIESISTSIVRWINNGFEGSPAFVQDLKSHFNQLESQVLGKYLNDIGFGFLCSPFADKIKRSLEIQLAIGQAGGGRNAKERQFRIANQCTLDDVLSSVGTTIDQFNNDFSKGGWPAWITVTQGKNNEIGAYLIVRNELFRRQGEAVANAQKELDYGRGFMSWKKKCGSYDTSDNLPPRYYDNNSDLDAGGQYDDPNVTSDSGGNVGPRPTNVDSNGDSLPDSGNYSGNCNDPDEGKIQTPGSVIEKQLNDALGMPAGRLQVADEINEIISALFSQLTKQVLGGAGGLLGTSKSSSGQPSYLDQVQNDTESIQTGLASLKQGIAGSLTAFNGYAEAKQSSYTIVSNYITTLEAWKTCLNEKIAAGLPYQNELGSVQAKLDAEKTKLEKIASDLSAALKYKLDLTQLNNSLTSVDTKAKLDAAYTKYTTITSGQGARFNVVEAKQEEDNIKSTYPALQSQAQSGLQSCRFSIL